MTLAAISQLSILSQIHEFLEFESKKFELNALGQLDLNYLHMGSKKG